MRQDKTNINTKIRRKDGIIVLSLFDGISCGMVALERAGISVSKYYASEIDKYAIEISRKNYPQIIQLGDVTRWREWDIPWADIDLLIGGSPCQGFSFCGKQLNFNDPRSKLFFEYADILNHIKSFNKNIKFLLENVVMKNDYKAIISEKLECLPICIDSEIITPMRRKRLYWCNFSFSLPSRRYLTLKEICNKTVDNKLFLSDSQFKKITYNKDGLLYIHNLPHKTMIVNEYDGVILSRTWQVYMPIVRQKAIVLGRQTPMMLACVCLPIKD